MNTEISQDNWDILDSKVRLNHTNGQSIVIRHEKHKVTNIERTVTEVYTQAKPVFISKKGRVIAVSNTPNGFDTKWQYRKFVSMSGEHYICSVGGGVTSTWRIARALTTSELNGN